MRRKRQLRTVGVLGTAIAVVGLIVAGLLVSKWRGGPGISLPESEVLYEIHRVDSARLPSDPTEPVFVLVLGNDARPGETVSRADAIHLVGLNPAAGQATVVNIPRDTYVSIPGRGQDKINAAHARGGPQLMAATVSALAGVEIPYVITTGFVGFAAMVDELGGVDVNVPLAMNDPKSGAFFPAGPRRLNGAEALAFSRNRSIPGGDFKRTDNQGLLIVSALAQLQSQDTSVKATFARLATLMRHSRVDGASVPDLYRLGRLAMAVPAANVRSITLPGRGGSAGGASVVFMVPQGQAILADLADDGIVQGA